MKETWRWFGPPDPITLDEVRQTGARGIVSALHHVPSGTAWTASEIAGRRALIEAAGLDWDVIESIPVSEPIKTRTGPWKAHVEAWIASLRAVADAGGPRVICYNFMPVLDWTRTALREPLPNGGTAMRFDLVDFALFDLHLLKRAGAEADYSPDVVAEATRRAADIDGARAEALAANVTAGLPGSNESWTLDDVRARIADYDGVDPRGLRANLVAFLGEVVPVAEELGLKLCCHPDDPPFPLLGLPRVMSTLDDYREVLDAVPSPANGATLCTGSLGVRADFDPVAFVEALGNRIHFVHLRNTRRDAGAAGLRVGFQESAHLDGDTDMVATIRALMAEEARRRSAGRPDAEIPMRPDHGHDLLDDVRRRGQPGYPLVGRMRGLAELRGVMAAIGHGPS
ncbi:mannonate dehydratase [Roseibacterium sp. SDUM158017]|uniref:mannonate dehydratase n=1 Tax=Roseicyclus salinarum TaxID=3036773 RepID=UPI0024152B3D|nr:mannonate dehydratase [Roseibacterium sp. SDUM158017]MDG4646838.1 mannonate dehydratase [Roseibacterium sp. SDUM158017]